ncbi:MAG TPA: hypothetical protein VGR69_05315 [Candidatus Rubrimentiphilum sp.]|nr:hypothetical protein [Candidatus Rubrimentiphilum sp.]
MSKQEAFTLIEAAVACGVVALSIAVLFLAAAAFAKFGTRPAGPDRAAATLLAEQTLRVAEDAWKYGSIGNAPAGTWSTTLPIATGGTTTTSIPVTVTSSLANSGAAGASISITVAYPPDPNHNDPGSVSVNGTLRVRAPLPGARVAYPVLVPLPPGAP